MSFYNMLFGRNPHTDVLLAVIGLRPIDVERLRDVHLDDDGATICVYTRTGGNNREDYEQIAMRHRPGWRKSVDDDYDNTYCTDYFDVPEQWRQDVANFGDITKGLRAEFCQHLAVTLNREPTEADKAQSAHDAEFAELKRTSHFMANGHTFVPRDDSAMEVALKLAEANGGKLRTCWGIAPLALEIKRDYYPYPTAKDAAMRAEMIRASIDYSSRWVMDEAYWQHCRERWETVYPLTMAEIAKSVAAHKAKK